LAIALSPALTAAILGWFAVQMRRNNKVGNPGNFEGVKECVRAEAKETREALHGRFDRLEDRLELGVNRIVDAINRRRDGVGG